MLARDFAATLDAERFRACGAASSPASPAIRASASTISTCSGCRRRSARCATRSWPSNPDLHPSGAHACALIGDWETFYAAKRSRIDAQDRAQEGARHREARHRRLRRPHRHGRTPAHPRCADGAEGAVARPHGRRELLRPAGLSRLLPCRHRRPGDARPHPHRPAHRRRRHRRHQRRPRLRRLLLPDPGKLRRRSDLRPRPRHDPSPRAASATPSRRAIAASTSPSATKPTSSTGATR